MDQTKDILERYYRGETTVAEEKILREKFRQGDLAENPILGYKGEEKELPDNFTAKFRQNIQQRKSHQMRLVIIASISVAAMLILLVSIRGLFPADHLHEVQLSDNIKRARFEEALRVIGNVLDEKPIPEEQILYEDSKLIIAIE